MALTIIVLILLALLVLWSFSSGLNILDDAIKNRKPKGPCPYCGSPLHKKSYHVPGGK
jgi:hypothetical protein